MSELFLEEKAKLIADDGTAQQNFGTEVDIDGNTFIVGTYSNQPGSAYVFVKVDGAWIEQAKLTPSERAYQDYFGSSVAIKEDTALVGAWGSTVGENDLQGAAYVFVRNGDTWTEQAKLTAGDGITNQHFGVAVAIDRDTIVVGADYTFPGSAYVFVRNGNTWTQQAKLMASDGIGNNNFGASLAIDGDTIIIEAGLTTVNNNQNQGAAYVFFRNGDTWTQQAKLTANDGASNDYFGNPDLQGNVAVIGASGATNGVYQGTAYVFIRSGNTWAQQAKLIAEDGAAGDGFGWPVKIDSNTIIVGAATTDVNASTDQGAAYVFVQQGSDWVEQAKLTAADGEAGSDFGIAAAIDGTTVVIGADNSTIDVYANQGAVYVFERTAPKHDGPIFPAINYASRDQEASSSGISLLDREKRVTETDLVVASTPQPLEFTRIYRQSKQSDFNFMGLGWTHSHHMTLKNLGGSPVKLEVLLPSGGIVQFTAEGTNSFRGELGADAVIDYDEVTDQYVLTTPDTQKFIFEPTVTDSTNRYRLIERHWMTGDQWTYAYESGSDRLSTVDDGQGRQLVFSYYSDMESWPGQLKQVQDHAGRYIEFDYAEIDSAFALKNVTDIAFEPG